MSSFNHAIVVADIILPVFAAVATGLRFYSRKIMKHKLEGDDFTILFALMLTIGLCAAGVYEGLSVPEENAISGADDLAYIISAYIAFFCVVFGNIIVGLVKISVILFYKRIFFVSRRFNTISNIFIMLIVVWVLTVLIGHLSTYSGGPGQWFIPYRYREYYKIDWSLFMTMMVAFDITLDLMVLSMPWRLIYHIPLSRKQKILVSICFLLGALCIVPLAVRMYYITGFLRHSATDYLFNASVVKTRKLNVLWIRIEACTSIIAACLPALYPVFKAIHAPMWLSI